MKKVLIVTGATATGKTSVALSLAHTNTILNADSIQVYKDADVISGKDIPKGSPFKTISAKPYKTGYYKINSHKLFGVDITETTHNFSVFDFVEYSTHLLTEKSFDQNKFAIAGGTAQYIRALLHRIKTSHLPRNDKLRNELAKMSVKKLQKLLQNENEKILKTMNQSDKNNPRRLIRAIEITRSKDKKVNTKQEAVLDGYKHQTLALYTEREQLKKTIDKRIAKRIKDGAFEEAQQFFKEYKKLSESLKKANGYRQIFEYFQKKSTKEEAVQKWKYSEYLHAKNQNTYIKKYLSPIWINTSENVQKAVHAEAEKLFN